MEHLKDINLTTPEHVSLNFKLAGLGSRGTAYIIDTLIIGVIYGSFTYAMVKLSTTDLFLESFQDMSGYVTALIILILFLLWWGYFVLFEYFASGRTPGKMLAGIKVIQDNGQSLTFLSSMIRNLFRIVDFLPFLFLVGILLIFFHPRYKRVGDIAGGTLVIYKRKARTKKKKALPLQKEPELPETKKIVLDQWSIQKFTTREWDLLKTYILRLPSLRVNERSEMTRKVAGILLPRIGYEITNKPSEELEDDLKELYSELRNEWDYLN